MIKRILFAAFLAMIGAEIFGFISYNYIGWYKASMKRFQNERFLSWTIRSNAETDGVYVIPYPFAKGRQKQAQSTDAINMFCSVSRKGLHPQGALTRFISCVNMFIAATLIGFCIARANKDAYLARVGVATLLGFIASFAVHVEQWIDWAIPLKWTLTTFFENIVVSFVIGLIIGAIVRPECEGELDD